MLFTHRQAGEKTKEDKKRSDWYSEGSKPLVAVNPYLQEIEQELSVDQHVLDAYLSFLYLYFLCSQNRYGIVCKAMKLTEKAHQSLTRAVSLNPWLWSAWQELESFVTSTDDVGLDHLEMILTQSSSTRSLQILLAITSWQSASKYASR